MYIILFQFRVTSRHVIIFFYKGHFELSTSDVIVNIVVPFSLRFVENMLNMS